MWIILVFLLILVVGGLLLRLSKYFNTSIWKVIIYIVVWSVSGYFYIYYLRNGLFENLIPNLIFLKWLFIPIIIFLPSIIILIFKLIGRFVCWALEGWIK